MKGWKVVWPPGELTVTHRGRLYGRIDLANMRGLNRNSWGIGPFANPNGRPALVIATLDVGNVHVYDHLNIDAVVLVITPDTVGWM